MAKTIESGAARLFINGMEVGSFDQTSFEDNAASPPLADGPLASLGKVTFETEFTVPLDRFPWELREHLRPRVLRARNLRHLMALR